MKQYHFGDGFGVLLKCHDPNGKLYNGTFILENVTIARYEADSIRKTIESCADDSGSLIPKTFFGIDSYGSDLGPRELLILQTD